MKKKALTPASTKPLPKPSRVETKIDEEGEQMLRDDKDTFVSNKFVKRPAIIDIVQEDHIYTATVNTLMSLENYCSDLVEAGKQFRIGSIRSYGTISVNALTIVLNRLSRYGTYNRNLNK